MAFRRQLPTWRSARWAALLMVFGAPGWAQTLVDGGLADVGDAGVLTKPPALLKQVAAVFPLDALDAGVGGVVEMEIDIGPDGKVMDARVVKSAGASFDQAALEAVKQFEFSPAEVDGAPAPVRIHYAYEFFFQPQAVETPVESGVVNFSGLLLERGTRRPLVGATVAVGEQTTHSDETGRFSFTDVPVGKHTVVVTSPEHARYEVSEEIHTGARTEATYHVRRQVYGVYETVVRAPRERKEVAQISLKQEEIRLIPGTQGDAFKVVQNLPGVSRAPFSLGLLVVRGGKPWDTRTYVDEAFIPLLFHFGGLYATFNSNLLEDITFHPGNFSAEYGRNIGGLVSGKTRPLAKDGFHGYADVNLIDASGLLEGPLSDDWSFSASARRSYIDVTLPFVVKTFVPKADLLAFTVAPRYYDYQLKLERRPKGSKSRFSVSFFGSNDELAFVLPNPAYDPEGRGTFQTLLMYNRLAVHFETPLGENLRLSSSNVVGYDRFEFGGGTDIFFRSTTTPVMSRESLDIELPTLHLSLVAGADVYLLPIFYDAQSPPRFKLNQIPDPFASRQLVKETGSTATLEPAVFAEAVWKPWPQLKVVAGLRADYETYMKDGWVDPRGAVFLDVREGTTLKAAAGLFHQPPDYRQGLLSPKFGNPDLLPEAASHYSVGVEHRFTDALSLDVQGYYKDLFHQSNPTLAPAAGSEADADTVDVRYTSDGVGRSYGVELLLRHQLTRNFFGWISYSLSKSERYYTLDGKWGLHPLDQPHNLIAVASYKLPLDFIAGVRLRYASGALNTPYVGAIYDANGNYYYPLPGELFSRRLPAFFQADVRLDKRFVFDKHMLAVYLDVQNVTNRGNVEAVSYNFDYTREQFLYGLPILPSLGVRGEF
ncbi:MAG: TonB-dependent receptor domain-containing protein [Myxococcota bacterium]